MSCNHDYNQTLIDGVYRGRCIKCLSLCPVADCESVDCQECQDVTIKLQRKWKEKTAELELEEL